MPHWRVGWPRDHTYCSNVVCQWRQTQVTDSNGVVRETMPLGASRTPWTTRSRAKGANFTLTSVGGCKKMPIHHTWGPRLTWLAGRGLRGMSPDCCHLPLHLPLINTLNVINRYLNNRRIRVACTQLASQYNSFCSATMKHKVSMMGLPCYGYAIKVIMAAVDVNNPWPCLVLRWH